MGQRVRCPNCRSMAIPRTTSCHATRPDETAHAHGFRTGQWPTRAPGPDPGEQAGHLPGRSERSAGWTTGPVVTQFEVIPAEGVKVGQIAALSDDLALALKAPSVRIVAPDPGQGCAVGVEIPNPEPEIVQAAGDPRVRLAGRRHAGALPLGLGRDLDGDPYTADLAKMPHLLIAGATGSGKSVCINTIITSLVYRYSPRDLRLLDGGS